MGQGQTSDYIAVDRLISHVPVFGHPVDRRPDSLVLETHPAAHWLSCRPCPQIHYEHQRSCENPTIIKYIIHVDNRNTQYMYTIEIYSTRIQYKYTIYVYNTNTQYMYTIQMHSTCIHWSGHLRGTCILLTADHGDKK